MAKLWEFLQGHPKPVFFSKVQRGDQGKFFKNRPKGSPRLKGPKPFWRIWHYPLISMLLKCKDWTRFCGKKLAPKVPEWPSYSNFCNVTHNPHFLKKCKGWTQGNFPKIAKKGALVWKAKKHSGARSPKTRIFWEVQREEDQEKCFKNRPKRSPRLKGPKELRRIWHYPLISMHLTCKDWRRFLRKTGLQKCPNGQVMAIFARLPQTRIFWKNAKGGPREIFKKSPKR